MNDRDHLEAVCVEAVCVELRDEELAEVSGGFVAAGVAFNIGGTNTNTSTNG